MTMVNSLPVGSASWTNGDELESGYGEPMAEHVRHFINRINSIALLAYASALRNGQESMLSTKFSVGSYYLVRKIRFYDGIEWIVRLRMPPMPDQDTGMRRPYDRESIRLDMQSELATMDFVRRNTNIPIPEVYASQVSDNNTIGCPFIIMDYVNGNTAHELSLAHHGDHGGVPEVFREKFWRQVAKITVQLASIRMPKIGSLHPGGDGSIVVGPLIETGTGPYDTAAEFYSDYPLALSRSLGQEPTSGQEELVQAFRSLAVTFPPPLAPLLGDPAESFGLTNYDLNPANIIVDRDFNILGVIDWDCVVAVPEAALYRFPILMGIDGAPPGSADPNPLVVRRKRLGRRFAQVVENVGWAETRLDGMNIWPTCVLTKAEFFSKEAWAFRALLNIKFEQDWVNMVWLQGLRWLSEHSEEEVARFCLGE